MTTPTTGALPATSLQPSVASVLQNTPMGPYLGQSAPQVIAGIGLPALPQVPAASPFPGVPPLPQIDPNALIKPVTDLLGGFGTGNLGTNGALNPQTVLSNVTQAVNTAMQLGQTGFGLLQQLQGLGAQSATAGATATQASSAAVGSQAVRMNAGVGAASTTVAVGSAQMSAVVAKFVATTVAIGPALATPPGQIAMLVNSVDSGMEATAVTASTKSQLAVHAANMTATGSPVTVSGSGLNSNLSSQLQQLASVGQSAVSAGQQVISAGQKGSQAISHAQPVAAQTTVPGLTGEGLPATEDPGGVAALGAAGAVAGTDAVAPAQRMSAWQGDAVDEAAALSGEAAPAVSPAAAVSETLPPPMLGAAGLGKGVDATYSSSPALINATNSEQLVGTQKDDQTAPVVGAAVEYGFGTPDDVA